MSNSSSDNGCDELLFQVDWLMLWTIVSSVAFGLAGLAIYIYYFQKGQFEDSEDVKYQLFRNEEEEK